MESTYEWIDYFTKQRHSCRCEVLGRGRTGTTATVKLLEYGPGGRPPGTRMTVSLKFLGLKPERQVTQTKLDWHRWTD